MYKKIIWSLVAVLLIILIGYGVKYGYQQYRYAIAWHDEQVYIYKHPYKISPVDFLDLSGRPVDKNIFNGKWTYLVLGYVNSYTVTPTQLFGVDHVWRYLVDNTRLYNTQVVFVTIDPDRDNVTNIKKYLSLFNENFIGLHADCIETQKFIVQFNNFFNIKKETKDNKDYFLDYTDVVILLDPGSRVHGYIQGPVSIHTLHPALLRMQTLIN